MADEKRIVIEIVSNGSKSDGMSTRISTSETKSTDESSLWEMEGGNTEAAKMAETAQKAAGVAALSLMVVNSVGGQVMRQASMYFTLTENYKSQQDITNMKSVANHIGGIVGKVGAGAMAGSLFGPVGAAVGAGIGAGVAAFDTIMGGLNTQFEQNLDISTKGYTVQYNRNLAGLIAGENENTEN